MQPMRPSETMTVATLAAEIRRQADYHAGRDYPFPRLSIQASDNTLDGRHGSVRLTSDRHLVEVIAHNGTAHVVLFSPAGDRQLAVSVAEWSAAMHAMAPFLPAAEETPPAVVTVPWRQ
jgi:hypothetical protein